MTDKQKQLLGDAVLHPAKYGIRGCALCYRLPIQFTALFVPTESFGKRIGQPAGKQRLVVYGLCAACSELPNLTDRVEAAMLRNMGVQ